MPRTSPAHPHPHCRVRVDVRVLALAAAGALGSGCFGSSTEPTPYETFLVARERAAAALCEGALECAPEQAAFACVRTAFGAGPDSTFATSLNRGRRALDAEGTEACIAALATSCFDAARVTACPVLRPTLLAGEPCALDEECVTRACGGPCPSRCVEPDRSIAFDGEPCGSAAVRCDEGLVCARFPARPGETCGSPAAAGEGCASNAGCSAPLECVVGTCATVPLAEGDPCNGAQCPDGLRCVDASCRRPPGEGESCVGRRCGARLRCVDDVCAPFAAPGEPCDENADCLVTFDCRDGTCTQRPLLGEPCDAERACLAGECVDDVCAADDPPPPGQPCGDDVCGEGSVCRWAGDGRGCLPLCE